jgi:hypothetical protein
LFIFVSKAFCILSILTLILDHLDREKEQVRLVLVLAQLLLLVRELSSYYQHF